MHVSPPTGDCVDHGPQRVTSELLSAREQLADTLADAAREKDALRAQHAAALEAERDRFKSRLAVEIERTNAAEVEVCLGLVLGA